MSSNVVDCRTLGRALQSLSSFRLRHPANQMTDADRLDSWKEIAGYLRRDVKTVQRWEKREGMPVHRHLHDKLGSVYAFRSELDVWSRDRRLPQDEATSSPVAPAASVEPRVPPRQPGSRAADGDSFHDGQPA